MVHKLLKRAKVGPWKTQVFFHNYGYKEIKSFGDPWKVEKNWDLEEKLKK